MSEADRYFIKKGFSKVIKQGIEEFTDDDGNYIHFDLVIERFTCNCYLSAKELQAINKKVEELRMDMSNKTSDKNVVTEEDLEVLNEVLLHNRETEQARIAIEHMLAEREQDKKRIQELEADLYSSNEIIADLTDSIPKQVVIDKMEELNKEIKSCDEIDAIFKIKQQQVLQELLEGGRK